jgi:hypothetical protein
LDFSLDELGLQRINQWFLASPDSRISEKTVGFPRAGSLFLSNAAVQIIV